MQCDGLTHVSFCRSLEYTIHDHELRDTKKKLEELQDKRDNSGVQSQKIRDLQQSANDKVKVKMIHVILLFYFLWKTLVYDWYVC